MALMWRSTTLESLSNVGGFIPTTPSCTPWTSTLTPLASPQPPPSLLPRVLNARARALHLGLRPPDRQPTWDLLGAAGRAGQHPALQASFSDTPSSTPHALVARSVAPVLAPYYPSESTDVVHANTAPAGRPSRLIQSHPHAPLPLTTTFELCMVRFPSPHPDSQDGVFGREQLPRRTDVPRPRRAQHRVCEAERCRCS